LPQETKDRRIDWGTVAAFLVIVLAAAAMVAPGALRGGSLTHDGYEHLAIAHSWLAGAGFVNPVQWHYYLDLSPPLPATAVRAPVISLLAALPLAAGATIPTVIVSHAVWSALVVGALFLVASRFMRRRAAAAAALVVAAFPSWNLYLAVAPLTEVTATGCYLLVLVTAGGVLRSRRGALLCAAATLLAALTRPNLSALATAVGVAAVWEVGVRHALRERRIWIYVLAFAAAYLVVGFVVHAVTGVGLYAGYGVQTEMLSYADVWRYDREYEGFANFVQQRGGEIAARIRENAVQLSEALTLHSSFNLVGWLLPFAVLYGIARPRDGILFHRINAFSILGFSLILIVNYSAFEAARYPLWIAVPVCLTGAGLLDVLAQRLERRVRTKGVVARLRLRDRICAELGWLPLSVAALVSLTTVHLALEAVPDSWQRYERARRGALFHEKDDNLLALCVHIDPDAVVASSNPWRVFYWCGNAGVRIPIDPVSDEVRDRFVEELRVAYIVISSTQRRPGLDSARWLRSLESSDGFRLSAHSGSLALYEVSAASPGTRPWTAPPPLVCAGLGPDCVHRMAPRRRARFEPAAAVETRRSRR
jgi:hypothetical protein